MDLTISIVIDEESQKIFTRRDCHFEIEGIHNHYHLKIGLKIKEIEISKYQIFQPKNLLKVYQLVVKNTKISTALNLGRV